MQGYLEVSAGMNGTLNKGETERVDEERALDPHEAAKLLEQTTQKARRGFNYRTPALSMLGAAVVLVAFGALWLSVRGQHPYKGPTAPALLFMYGVLIAWITVVVSVARRANAGVSGRSIRQQYASGVVLGAALVAVSVFQGVLKADGVSHAIVYGIYPPTAQLIVMGAIGASFAAGREEWPGFGVAIAIMAVATASAFAGPVGVWLWNGIGCAVAVLGYTAAQAWVSRR
jgi:hypothetical protein